MGGYSSARSGSPDAATTNFNLEEELQTTADPAVAAMRLELSKLKAENQLLRDNMGVAADNERLRVDLDLANQKVDHLRQQHQDVSIQHGLAMAQINALLAELPKERYVETAVVVLEKFGPFALLTPEYFRDEAWARVSNDLRNANQELERFKESSPGWKPKADQERDLHAAQADRALLTYLSELGGDTANNLGLVTAVGQDSVEALELAQVVRSAHLRLTQG